MVRVLKKKVVDSKSCYVPGLIIGVMFLFVSFGYSTGMFAAVGAKQQVVFHLRVCQFGLTGAFVATVGIVFTQKFRWGILFFLELLVALSIILAQFRAYQHQRYEFNQLIKAVMQEEERGRRINARNSVQEAESNTAAPHK